MKGSCNNIFPCSTTFNVKNQGDIIPQKTLRYRRQGETAQGRTVLDVVSS